MSKNVYPVRENNRFNLHNVNAHWLDISIEKSKPYLGDSEFEEKMYRGTKRIHHPRLKLQLIL